MGLCKGYLVAMEHGASSKLVPKQVEEEEEEEVCRTTTPRTMMRVLSMRIRMVGTAVDDLQLLPGKVH